MEREKEPKKYLVITAKSKKLEISENSVLNKGKTPFSPNNTIDRRSQVTDNQKCDIDTENGIKIVGNGHEIVAKILMMMVINGKKY